MNYTIEQLNILLANSYALYLKTQNYHWNIEDRCFYALHKALEKQYKYLAHSIDDIAERIRQLGEKVVATFSVFNHNKTLKNDGNHQLDSQAMLQDLQADHLLIRDMLVDMIKKISDDEVTIDFLTGLQTWHEKQIWMLTSSIDSSANAFIS